jgi:hypothetical protein
MIVGLLPTGDYKAIFQYIDADKNKTIMELEVAASYKGVALKFF